MQFDDGFALRNGIENLGDTVRYVVLDNVFHKESRQCDTNHWSNEIPPMVLRNELVLNEMLNAMNHELQQLRCTRCQRSHEKTQDKNEVFLWDMLLTPSNKSVVC